MKGRILGGLTLAVVSLATVGETLYVVLTRVAYPFELTKMEGVIVDHVRRVATGQAIYGPPSAEFVPLLYFPLAYYPPAWLMRAGLDGFLAARLASLLAVIGSILVGIWLVYRATGRKWLAAMVPVLIAATYFDAGCFYDQARSDNLMTLLYLLCVVSLTLNKAVPAVALFSVFGLLTVLTKQSAIVLVGGLLAGTLLIRPAVALWSSAMLAALTGISLYWGNLVTDGWLNIYCIKAPAFHGLGNRRLVDGISLDFLGVYALLTAAVAASAVVIVQSRSSFKVLRADQTAVTWTILLIASVAAGLFSLASIWQMEAVRNVFVVFAITGSVFLPAALSGGMDWLERTGQRSLAAPLAVLVIVMVVLGGVRNPEPYLPTDKDVATWRQLREALLRYGPPERSWLTLHGAGFGATLDAPMRPHYAALFDYVGGHFGEKTGFEMPSDLLQLIKDRYFTAVLVADWDYRTKSLLGPFYERAPDSITVRVPAFYGKDPAAESIWVPRLP